MRFWLTGFALLLLLPVHAHAQIPYNDQPAPPFVIQGNRWPSNTITFAFGNQTNDVPETGPFGTPAEYQAVRQAFTAWSNASGVRFFEIPTLADADIIVRWEFGNHGDGFPFDNVNGVLAHAFFPPPNSGPLAGDIHFDDAENYTLNLRADSAQPLDLQTVAVHEIGHSLGLDHSNVLGAVMEPIYMGSRRALSQDDINGVRQIYGTNPGPVCDEKPIFQYFNGTDHFYTTTYALGFLGYGLQTKQGALCQTQVAGSVPFFQYFNGTDHFYTTTFAPGGFFGYQLEQQVGFVFPTQQAGTVPLFLFFNGVDHLYTVRNPPGGFPGYTFESIAGFVVP
jgi:hypothetical protein